MVEYRHIKSKEELKKPINPTGEPQKISETFATTQIPNEHGIEVATVQQNALTANCWLVQFRGFKACAECEVYLKPDCGGGATLAKMIIDHFKDNLVTKYAFNAYFGDKTIDEDPTFMGFIKHTKKDYLFSYSLKKYKRHIKDLQNMALEPEGRDLDAEFPFWEHYNQPNHKTISYSGYHQSAQCTCRFTTRKGSYRDVIIEQRDENGSIVRQLNYYHQHCIMVRENGRIWVSSCGFRTSTTKERLNGYLFNYHIQSVKGVWRLKKWRSDESELFYDGMEITT